MKIRNIVLTVLFFVWALKALASFALGGEPPLHALLPGFFIGVGLIVSLCVEEVSD